MIERGFSVDVIAELAKPDTKILLFADIDWKDGQRVRAHTGLGTRKMLGDEYLGVGEYGGISEVTESSNTSPNQLRLTLKVLDTSLVAMGMNDSPEGREVFVHMAILDDNRVIKYEVPYLVDGNVASFDVLRGDVNKEIPYVFQITCSDWLERWTRPPENGRTSDSAQQYVHPGDRIFDLTEIISAAPLSELPVKNVGFWDLIKR